MLGAMQFFLSSFLVSFSQRWDDEEKVQEIDFLSPRRRLDFLLQESNAVQPLALLFRFKFKSKDTHGTLPTPFHSFSTLILYNTPPRTHTVNVSRNV